MVTGFVFFSYLIGSHFIIISLHRYKVFRFRHGDYFMVFCFLFSFFLAHLVQGDAGKKFKKIIRGRAWGEYRCMVYTCLSLLYDKQARHGVFYFCFAFVFLLLRVVKYFLIKVMGLVIRWTTSQVEAIIRGSKG